jgi:hypothetical protein
LLLARFRGHSLVAALDLLLCALSLKTTELVAAGEEEACN